MTGNPPTYTFNRTVSHVLRWRPPHQIRLHHLSLAATELDGCPRAPDGRGGPPARQGPLHSAVYSTAGPVQSRLTCELLGDRVKSLASCFDRSPRNIRPAPIQTAAGEILSRVQQENSQRGTGTSGIGSDSCRCSGPGTAGRSSLRGGRNLRGRHAPRLQTTRHLAL